MARVKERIIELLNKGPRTLDEIVQEISSVKPRIVKGILTRLRKAGKVVEEGGRYKLK